MICRGRWNWRSHRVSEFAKNVLKSDLPTKGTEKQPFGEGANPWHLTSQKQVQVSYGYKPVPVPLPTPSSGDYLKRRSVYVLILSPSRCLCLPLREELKMLYNRVSFPTPKSWAGLTWNAWQHHYCLQVKAKRHTLILIALKPFVGYKKVHFKNRRQALLRRYRVIYKLLTT